jgi:hypothetical protein
MIQSRRLVEGLLTFIARIRLPRFLFWILLSLSESRRRVNLSFDRETDAEIGPLLGTAITRGTRKRHFASLAMICGTRFFNNPEGTELFTGNKNDFAKIIA